MLLYFVKSKNDTKCKNFNCFIVFLGQSIHCFVLPKISGRGGYAYNSPSHPLNLRLIIIPILLACCASYNSYCNEPKVEIKLLLLSISLANLCLLVPGSYSLFSFISFHN